MTPAVVLAKPFAIDTLLDRIAELLPSCQTGQQWRVG